MSRSPNSDPSVERTSDKDANKEVMRRASEDVLRRASEITNEIDEFDLSENYQTAVDCLVSCESIINTLQEELASKDEHIASLEEKLMQMSEAEQIASLEEKLVNMSLELALTKAHADELEHRLKPRSTSASSNECSDASPALIAFNEAKWQPTSKNRRKTHASPSSNEGSDPSPAFITFNETRLQSTSKNDRKTHVSHHHSWSRYPMDDTAKTSFTTAVSAKTSLTGDNSHSDHSNTSRLSNLGHLNLGHFFLKKSGSQKDRGEVQVDEKNEEEEQNNVSDERPQRRAPNHNRMELQKSSRSFLEANGVIFPVSSFEVLKKGCITKIDSKGGSNESWPEFGQSDD